MCDVIVLKIATSRHLEGVSAQRSAELKVLNQAGLRPNATKPDPGWQEYDAMLSDSVGLAWLKDQLATERHRYIGAYRFRPNGAFRDTCVLVFKRDPAASPKACRESLPADVRRLLEESSFSEVVGMTLKRSDRSVGLLRCREDRYEIPTHQLILTNEQNHTFGILQVA